MMLASFLVFHLNKISLNIRKNNTIKHIPTCVIKQSVVTKCCIKIVKC